jgi:hypothetical protein
VKRRLFTLTTIASMLLCIASVAMWVRSYFVGDVVEYTKVNGLLLRRVYFNASTGLVCLGGERREYTTHLVASQLMHIEGVQPGLRHLSEEPEDWWAPEMGSFFADRQSWNENSGAFSQAFVVFPHWLVFLLSAMLPAALFVHRLRRRRVPAHLCGRCGYDLRATPERCPECGAVPAAAAR